MEFSEVVSLVDHLADELLIALREFCDVPAEPVNECCVEAEAPTPTPSSTVVVWDHKSARFYYTDARFEVGPKQDLYIFRQGLTESEAVLAYYPEGCYAHAEISPG